MTHPVCIFMISYSFIEMARATPSEIRWKVIILWKLFNYTVPQTCQALGLTRASVYNFRKLYNDTGRVDVNSVRRGRMPKLNEQEAAALVEHMKKDPSQHSTDFQDWFFRKFGKKLSKSTIGRYLHMRGYRKGKHRKQWVQVDINQMDSKSDFLKDIPKADYKVCFESTSTSGIASMAATCTALSLNSDETGSSTSSTPSQDQSYSFDLPTQQSTLGCYSTGSDTDVTTALQGLMQHDPLSSLAKTSPLFVKLELKNGEADFVKYFDDFVAACSTTSHPSDVSSQVTTVYN